MTVRALCTLLAVFTGLPGLAACTPEPQRLDAAEGPGYATDAWRDQLRERTLRQNESGRIY